MNLSWQLLFLALSAAGAPRPDFYVEEDGLSAPPSSVVSAIVGSQSEPFTDNDDRPCAYEGKRIDLDGDGSAQDWVVTTQDACSWAASAAPVWVVRGTDGPRVVLHFVTYSLTIGKAASHGLRHIATGRGTAAQIEEQLWKFDGRDYRLVRNRVIR
jgi:hypothetical protein